MMCLGNLKIIDEESGAKVAEFSVKSMSSQNVGTVTFDTDVDMRLKQELLYAFLAVADKEHVSEIASMDVAVTAAIV